MELRLNNPLKWKFDVYYKKYAIPEDVDLETALEYYSGDPRRYIEITNSCKAFADHKQIEFSQRTSILMGRTAYYIKIDLTICWISEELMNTLAGIQSSRKKGVNCKNCGCCVRCKKLYKYKEAVYGYMSCIVNYTLPKF